jgi:hypothetical protein
VHEIHEDLDLNDDFGAVCFHYLCRGPNASWPPLVGSDHPQEAGSLELRNLEAGNELMRGIRRYGGNE